MDRKETLRQTQAKLPDVDKWEMLMVSIPVIENLPIVINDEILPTTTHSYEVRYEKMFSDKLGKVIWRFVGIQ